MKKFYNSICSIYKLSTSKVRGSKVEVRTLLYENIKCSIWSKEKKYGATLQASQTNSNGYNLNLDSNYSNVAIGDIVLLNTQNYKVDNIISHCRANGKIDNYEIFISLTTKI